MILPGATVTVADSPLFKKAKWGLCSGSAISAPPDLLSLRLRLRRIVFDADTRAGRVYNLIIFGSILLSVAGLLVQPHPLRLAALGEVPSYVGQLEHCCLLAFIADVWLHLWVSLRPRKYLFSFYGLIDVSAVLFFFVPQICSGLILWILKFGRVLASVVMLMGFVIIAIPAGIITVEMMQQVRVYQRIYNSCFPLNILEVRVIDIFAENLLSAHSKHPSDVNECAFFKLKSY